MPATPQAAPDSALAGLAALPLHALAAPGCPPLVTTVQANVPASLLGQLAEKLLDHLQGQAAGLSPAQAVQAAALFASLGYVPTPSFNAAVTAASLPLGSLQPGQLVALLWSQVS
jgi:hypothetical protein